MCMAGGGVVVPILPKKTKQIDGLCLFTPSKALTDEEFRQLSPLH